MQQLIERKTLNQMKPLGSTKQYAQLGLSVPSKLKAIHITD